MLFFGKEANKIHFIGIGGIGVSAIAKFFLNYKKEVSGSDVNSSETIFILQNLGAKISIGHREENLGNETDLVIYSPAVPYDNPEFKKAARLGIPLFSYPEILGEVMSKYNFPIAVSGTNGKTTTASLTGLILERAEFDPAVIIGGKVKEWNGNLRFSERQGFFVAEACEYKRAMMNLNPKAIILTNIEEDHLDYYKNLEDIKSAFTEYISKLPPDGILVYNADDIASKEIIKTAKAKKISYSLKNEADLKAEKIIRGNGKQIFNLISYSKNLGEFEIFIPGDFNIYNCMAASALSLDLGVSPEIIKETLKNFRGTWRRFEFLGTLNGAAVISDYAHHPTAVEKTIKGAKDFFPGRKILAVFQPHQKDRTIKLFDKFTESFTGADEVIISEIYSVEGRNQTERDISSLDLTEAARKKYPHFKIFYSKNLEETKKMIIERSNYFDVILIMGAGDIYKVGEDVVKKVKQF